MCWRLRACTLIPTVQCEGTASVLILLRSIAFNALFYLNTIIYLIAALPTFFMPYRAIVAVAKSWGRTNLVLLRVVAGIDCEIRGREKIPRGPTHRRLQTSVGMGNVRAAAAARQSGLYPQARAAVDSDLRLADHQGPNGAGPARRRFAVADRHDRTRAHRIGRQPATDHLSRKARGGLRAPSPATRSA